MGLKQSLLERVVSEVDKEDRKNLTYLFKNTHNQHNYNWSNCLMEYVRLTNRWSKETAEMLIEAGNSLHVDDYRGGITHAAACNKNYSQSTEILEWLLEKGAQWDAIQGPHKSPLMQYLVYNMSGNYNTQVLKYYLSKSDVNIVDQSGKSALMYAMLNKK